MENIKKVSANQFTHVADTQNIKTGADEKKPERG